MSLSHFTASVKKSIPLLQFTLYLIPYYTNNHFVLSPHQRSSRKKMCILVIVLVVVAVIIGLIIWGSVKQWRLLLLPPLLLHVSCLVISLDNGSSTSFLSPSSSHPPHEGSHHDCVSFFDLIIFLRYCSPHWQDHTLLHCENKTSAGSFIYVISLN